MTTASPYNVFFALPDDGRTLVLNTLTRSSLIIEPELADYLSSGRCSVQTVDDRDLSDLLLSAGILVPDGVDHAAIAKHTRIRTRFAVDYMHLTAFVTSGCNFRCSYCYQDIESPDVNMTLSGWARLRSYVERYLETNGLKRLTTDLFGGEPLLNPAVVERAARELHSLRPRGIRSQTKLITNGSLLGEKLLARISPFIDYIQITIDGPKARHNKLRPFANGAESYDVALRALERCLHSSIPVVTLRVNFGMDDVQDVKGFLDELRGSRLPTEKLAAAFSPIVPPLSVTQTQPCAQDPIEREAVFDLIDHAADRGFLTAEPRYPPGPCIATVATSHIVDAELNVYRCLNQAPNLGAGRIGEQETLEVTAGYWHELAVSDPDCVYTCAYGPMCSGPCPIAEHEVVRDTENCEHMRTLRPYIERVALSRLRSLSATVSE